MIDPKPTDIGRLVVYRPGYTGAAPEQGIVISYNDRFVFVRYGGSLGGKATRREDLEWANAGQPNKLVEAALVESILED